MNGFSKIDPELMIATQLSDEELKRSFEAGIGYDPVNRTWRLIIKYGGDIRTLADKYHGFVDILSDSYAVMTIREDLIQRFANETEVEYIEKPKGLIHQTTVGLFDTCIEPVNDYAAYALKGDGVLIGIIDSGIDYSHPDFLTKEGKTRVLRIWDQTGKGTPPEGYHHGTEYKESEINEILKNRSYGMVLPAADLSGHGTMVAGVAAGNGSVSDGAHRGAAPNASLLIVRLGTPDYDGYPIKTIDVMYGVHYLINTAQKLNMPIAINLSYGSPYGCRNGQGLFETYLDDMALHWKTAIVTGSGNDAAKRMHISGNTNANDTIYFSINGYTPNVSLEIWKPNSDEVNLEIIYPGGGSTGMIPSIQQVLRYGYRNEFIIVYASPPTPISTNDGIHIEIITTLGYLEEGIWTVHLHPKNTLNGSYEVWLHGNENCTVMNPTLENTLTLPGTVQNLITVAAYNHLTGNIANFSGQGSSKMKTVKPDISAPGVEIMTAAVSGRYENTSGTSIAAPFVTGACALLMQWGIVNKHDPYLYGNKLKASLFQGCIRDKDMLYPNHIWGYGKLCLQNVMDILMAKEIEPTLAVTEIKLPPFKQDPVQETELPPSKKDFVQETELPPSKLDLIQETEPPPSKPDLIQETEPPPSKPDLIQETEPLPSKPDLIQETEPLPSKQDSAQENSAAYIEQLICSDEYWDVFIEKNEELLEYAKNNTNVIIGRHIGENEHIVHIKKSVYKDIIEKSSVVITSSSPLLLGLLDVYSANASNIISVNNHPSLNLKGKGVLIGIVDTGIDYTHPCFIDSAGNTIIKAIWDQTILTGNPPETFRFGTEYTEDQINEALRSEDPFSIVPSKDENGHGTFLSGVICSNNQGQYIGLAPEANILCVKLAPAKKYAKDSCMLFDDDVIAYQSTDVIYGLRYLAHTARKLNMPISILLAVGSSQGPHTGLSLVKACPYRNGAVVIAACGNEGSSMHHASGKIANSGESTHIQFSVAEGEKGLSLYIWCFSPDKMSISLISPSGEVIERVPIRNTLAHHLKLVLYESEIWINYILSLGAIGDQLTLVRFRNPEPGMWTILLYGDEVIDGRYDAYLPIKGWVKPETYFINSNSSCTMTVFDNALEVVTVGAYNHTNHHLLVESSKGPTRLGILRPDLIAPGVNITGPLPNNAYGTKSGTSVAAAHVAGASALLLQWGIVERNQLRIDTRSIRTMLIEGAKRIPGITYPNNQLGYGELDLLSVFDQINNKSKLSTREPLLDFDEDEEMKEE